MYTVCVLSNSHLSVRTQEVENPVFLCEGPSPEVAHKRQELTAFLALLAVTVVHSDED